MENNLVKCEICGLLMKTRLNGSHLKRQHNISLSDYIKLYPNSIIGKRTPKIKHYTCKICNNISKSANSLSRHLSIFHSLNPSQYYIKYYLNDIIPTCGCGCNQHTSFKNIEQGFHKYIHSHYTTTNILTLIDNYNKNTILNKTDLIDIFNKDPNNFTKNIKYWFPDTYNYINNNFNYNIPILNPSGRKRNIFAEKIYQYVYDIKGICCQCKVNPTSFRSFSHGYSEFCSKTCQQLNTANKYGVSNLFKSTIIKEKSKQTNLEKYGVDNYTKTEEYLVKTKNTKQKKYSDPTYNNKEKCKKTNMERYGVSNPNKLDAIKQKVKSTQIKKYGGMGFGSKLLKEQMKSTNIKKYGCEIPMHNQEVYNKCRKSSLKLKEYIFPSGKKEKVQGYEPFAINYLLQSYTEEDIIINDKLIPKISYELNGKFHKYYPDIYIKSTNTIIEIKSTWTNILRPIEDKLKKSATLTAGYNFLKLIFNYKGNLLTKEFYERN